MPTIHRDCVVFDDFLDPELHMALLDHALSQREAVEPAKLYRAAQELVDREFRSAELCVFGLGSLHEQFVERVMSQLDMVMGSLGIKSFPIGSTDVELVAHNDEARFGLHIDTFTHNNLSAQQSTRILSLVYYLHRQPKAFSGGELEIRPIGKGDPLMIAPRDNRLIAFPSYSPHEVHQVSCPSRDFADSRFAINMWLCSLRGRS